MHRQRDAVTGQIFTKYHEAIEAIRASRTTGAEADFMEGIGALPHFVFDLELAGTLDRRAMTSSMGAMKAAGVMHLPYPEMLVELWRGAANYRQFCAIREEGVGIFRMAMVQYGENPNGQLYIDPVFYADFEWSDVVAPDAEEIVNADGTSRPVGEPDPAASKWGFNIHFTDDKRKQLTVGLGFGLMVAVMMTNISGLDRELVSPKPLNKARARKGKPRITDHTIVRIGHVYNESGQKIRLTDANRRGMTIHMRSAHTRRQQHGAKWVEENPELAALPSNHGDHHIVLIPAVLVNFKDGSDLPLPKPKVVKL